MIKAIAFTFNVDYKEQRKKVIKSSITVEGDTAKELQTIIDDITHHFLPIVLPDGRMLTYFGAKIEDSYSFRDRQTNELKPNIKTLVLEADAFSVASI